MSTVTSRRQMGPLCSCTQFGGIKISQLEQKIWLFNINVKSVLLYRCEMCNTTKWINISFQVFVNRHNISETSNWIKLHTGNYDREQRKTY